MRHVAQHTALIRHGGLEPEVIEYLSAPPSRETLVSMISDAGLSVREAIREKGTPYLELGLDDPTLSDERLLDAMLAHPILINQPLVRTPLCTRLARPSEIVLDILPPDIFTSAFSKEDGEAVLDDNGRRVAS